MQVLGFELEKLPKSSTTSDMYTYQFPMWKVSIVYYKYTKKNWKEKFHML